MSRRSAHFARALPAAPPAPHAPHPPHAPPTHFARAMLAAPPAHFARAMPAAPPVPAAPFARVVPAAPPAPPAPFARAMPAAPPAPPAPFARAMPAAPAVHAAPYARAMPAASPVPAAPYAPTVRLPAPLAGPAPGVSLPLAYPMPASSADAVPSRRTLFDLAVFALALALGIIAAVLTSCSSKRIEAAPERASPAERPMSEPAPVAPSLAISPIAADRLCVTKGAAALGRTVTEPTVRAVALGTSGDAAALSFVFRGDTAVSRELASGESRRQLGLKLRAQDGCNLLYVMWRLDPKPSLSVSLKHNPGMRTHKECGANGYTRIKPARDVAASLAAVPALSPGASHTLRAELAQGELLAWIDDQLVWRGPLPAGVHDLAGPAGLRSDNVSFDLVSFAAPAPGASAAATASTGGVTSGKPSATGNAAGSSSPPPKCTPETSD